jgi:hypothetical protein
MLPRRAAIAPSFAERIAGPVRRMLEIQQSDGAIPWFEDGPWDAWNHGECVMALAVAGERDAAWAGMQALLHRQLPDGGFASEYGNALPMTADLLRMERVAGPKISDTNFTAYVATAALHLHLLGDPRAGDLWPMVQAAIDHVIARQHVQGDISWCAEAHGCPDTDDALIAGNASIHASIGHALLLGEALGDPQPRWALARARLGDALRNAPHRFGRSVVSRPPHAMDCYYPALTSICVDPRAHLMAHWSRFVMEGLGCRCVADEPWVTVAESCELAIAAHQAGMTREAAMMLAWMEARRDTDGAFWMGWQSEVGIDWPAEKPSWTQAAYVLACDAIGGETPAAGLFALRP